MKNKGGTIKFSHSTLLKGFLVLNWYFLTIILIPSRKNKILDMFQWYHSPTLSEQPNLIKTITCLANLTPKKGNIPVHRKKNTIFKTVNNVFVYFQSCDWENKMERIFLNIVSVFLTLLWLTPREMRVPGIHGNALWRIPRAPKRA